jgi:hypothetical protein
VAWKFAQFVVKRKNCGMSWNMKGWREKVLSKRLQNFGSVTGIKEIVQCRNREN